MLFYEAEMWIFLEFGFVLIDQLVQRGPRRRSVWLTHPLHYHLRI